jgi:hypothetical protein
MVVLKALGGVALLGFLASASAEQGAEPSASDSSPLSFMLTLRTQF